MDFLFESSSMKFGEAEFDRDKQKLLLDDRFDKIDTDRLTIFYFKEFFLLKFIRILKMSLIQLLCLKITTHLISRKFKSKIFSKLITCLESILNL